MENNISFIEQVGMYFSELVTWPFVLFGALILIALGVELLNRRRRADAVDYYETTFKTELAGLYPNPTNWPEDLALHLRPSFPLMRDAFENLRSFIPQKQLKGYNQAWNDFYDFCSMSGEADKNQSGETSAAESDQDQKLAFHRLVTDLLSYTDQFKR